MSWAEFLIRSHAYRRTEIKDWQKYRKVAYHALIAPHQDPKKLPKKESLFMPLGETVKTSNVSEAQKKAYMKAMEQYLSKQNGGT